MPWAVAAAAVSAGGSYLSAKEANKGKQNTNEPWGPQQEYLAHAFEQSKTALGDAQKLGTYLGPRVAGLNPYQTQGYNGVANFATNQGTGTANNLLGFANVALSQGYNFGANANSLYAKAGQDPTQQIIANGAQYAANPYLDGQIDAASRDIVRNFRENQLTGLDQGAAATGNMNSSRTGVAQGILARGAQDRIGDIAATMRGNAYQNGLGMAQSQYNSDLGNQLNANGQLLQSSNFGLNAATQGLNAGYNAYDALTRAGAGFQAHEQNILNGQRDHFKEQQNGQLDLIGKYMSIINGNFGSTSTQSGGVSPGAAALQGGLTGAMGGLGLYGKFQGMGNSSQPWANPNADSFNYFSSNYTPENYG